MKYLVIEKPNKPYMVYLEASTDPNKCRFVDIRDPDYFKITSPDELISYLNVHMPMDVIPESVSDMGTMTFTFTVDVTGANQIEGLEQPKGQVRSAYLLVIQLDVSIEDPRWDSYKKDFTLTFNHTIRSEDISTEDLEGILEPIAEPHLLKTMSRLNSRTKHAIVGVTIINIMKLE